MGGIAFILLGACILLWCIREFYVSGKGTLAPWSPPQNLVVTSLYRYVRNPMYGGVLLPLSGWALYFQSLPLALYAAVCAAAFHFRGFLHEEPWLEAHFLEDWKTYKKSVPRWLPYIPR